jgi:ribosome assembly protein YihI (activator of Der GTPase)
MHEERYDGADQEHHKKDLGDAHGAGSNATKAKKCGDQGNHKKDDCIVKHENIPFEAVECNNATCA